MLSYIFLYLFSQHLFSFLEFDIDYYSVQKLKIVWSLLAICLLKTSVSVNCDVQYKKINWFILKFCFV